MILRQRGELAKPPVTPSPGLAERPMRTAPRLYYGWVVAGTGFVVIALISPLMVSFPVFYVALLGDFGWSRGQLSMAMAIHLMLCGVATPLAGGLIDRFGPRRVMPIGAFVTAAALMALSQGTALWHFYVAFGVMAAIGSAMLHIVPMMAIISNWFVRYRGTAIGIVTSGAGAGQVLLLPLFQYLIDRIGWRSTYLVFGTALLLIPTTLIRRFVHVRPEDRGLTVEDELRRGDKGRPPGVDRQPVEPRPKLSRGRVVILDKEWARRDWTIGKAMGSLRFWALTLVMGLYAGGFFLISVQLVAYLADKGYSALLAASVVGLQGLINIMGKFVGGVLSDRVGRENTLTLSIALILICLVPLHLAGWIISPALLYTFVIFYGMGAGMALPALMTSAADLFQGRHFGSILGIMALGGFTGAAIGAWLGGHLFDLTNTYQVNFLVTALAMLVSVALIWKARPGRVRLVQRVPTSAEA